MTTDAAPHQPVAQTVYRPAHPVDLMRTVGMLVRGPNDPTMLIDGGRLWLAFRTRSGIATLCLRQDSQGIHAAAWGPGADEAIDRMPQVCGADDDPTGFDVSAHVGLAAIARRFPGIRLPRTDLVFEALACAILEQKVTGLQAFGAWRYLVTNFGERTPGPTPRPMFAAPAAESWRSIPSWHWHRAGVEPPQSRTIVRAASRAPSIVRALHAASDGDDRDRVLTSQPGIGQWTSAETRLRALGDPDAVALGDAHLPHEIGFALTGSRTDDAGMLELLSPWAGHRQRVIRLVYAAGIREPRRGPRLAPEDHRRR
ncbi:DNA-3-methyladenine glycosylase 2 family protein [Microbacterium esteraromaticum]|uniref:DNA-3-methyladenine glycosylase family protein n=1 Tax=Microbacterium esteraromaticum TaxID=57043 RepID=UPI001CD38274|nr:DNA-3-methyladenine glycosylase 2 family protein [Microbacterium esteraromaticum]MCA1305376.1 DNA-3-methyladenine glycosylase 2 family protein [Microbacterium esteraromaticum]